MYLLIMDKQAILEKDKLLSHIALCSDPGFVKLDEKYSKIFSN